MDESDEAVADNTPKACSAGARSHPNGSRSAAGNSRGEATERGENECDDDEVTNAPPRGEIDVTGPSNTLSTREADAVVSVAPRTHSVEPDVRRSGI